MILKHIVTGDQTGKTVKTILKQHLGISERLVKKLKYNDRVHLNGIPVFVNKLVQIGDIVEAAVDFIEESPDISPQDIDLDIIFEDEYLIAINKQPGIVVHPTSFHPDGTIANAIMHYWSKKGIHKKIRPVSRLDRDTSGVIIFAKNQFVQEFLVRQMHDETFIKEYIGVVSGKMETEKGTIDLPITRSPGSIMLRQISEEGAKAITCFKVMEQFRNGAILKFLLKTGRTHQIRVHCQAIGHPLIGDTLYSHIEASLIGRQALHSCRASFIHPLTKERMDLFASLPQDIENLICQLRAGQPV